MRNLRILVVTLFLLTASAFSALFLYDRLMLDHTAPVIVCDGVPLELSVSATDRELCAGLTATDDVDGDLTERIIVRRVSQLVGSNSAYVYYAVFDSASNYCTYTRPVYYTDYEKPHFSLTQPLIYNVGSTVALADRLFASDVIDGDISGRIRIGAAAVSNTVAGEYPISVQVSNSSGDTAVVSLTVSMQNYTSLHPLIRLTQYLLYVPQDSELDEATLRGCIASARTSATGEPVDAGDITIRGDVDTSKTGSYAVTYSYTNDGDLTYSVILTVIVE